MDDAFLGLREIHDLCQRCHELERRALEMNHQWISFMKVFSSYLSPMTLHGHPILPPVMTLERRREMLILQKQACIVEVRQRSRSRENDFLQRVQTAIDQLETKSRAPVQSSTSSTCSCTSNHPTECSQSKSSSHSSIKIAEWSSPNQKRTANSSEAWRYDSKHNPLLINAEVYDMDSAELRPKTDGLACSSRALIPLPTAEFTEDVHADIGDRGLIVLHGAKPLKRQRTGHLAADHPEAHILSNDEQPIRLSASEIRTFSADQEPSFMKQGSSVAEADCVLNLPQKLKSEQPPDTPKSVQVQVCSSLTESVLVSQAAGERSRSAKATGNKFDALEHNLSAASKALEENANVKKAPSVTSQSSETTVIKVKDFTEIPDDKKNATTMEYINDWKIKTTFTAQSVTKFEPQATDPEAVSSMQASVSKQTMASQPSPFKNVVGNNDGVRNMAIVSPHNTSIIVPPNLGLTSTQCFRENSTSRRPAAAPRVLGQPSLEQVSNHSRSNDIITVMEWLRNAPESIKMKLSEILPKELVEAADSKVSRSMASNIGSCTSVDDTLRNASPIHDEEKSVTSASGSVTQTVGSKDSLQTNAYISQDASRVVVDSLQHFGQSPEPSNSRTHAAIYNQINGMFCSIPSPSPLDEIVSQRVHSHQTEIQRKRNISAQSYTLDHPSAALLDSLHEPDTSQRMSSASATSQRMSSASAKTRRSAIPVPTGNRVTPQDAKIVKPVSHENESTARSSVHRRLEYTTPDHQPGYRVSNITPSLCSVSPTVGSGSISGSRSLKATVAHIKNMDKGRRRQSSKQLSAMDKSPKLANPCNENSPTRTGMSQSEWNKVATSATPQVRVMSAVDHGEKLVLPVDIPVDAESPSVCITHHLSLLKSKYRSKLSPRDTNTRPMTCQPPPSKESHSLVDRPVSAMDDLPSLQRLRRVRGRLYGKVLPASAADERADKENSFASEKPKSFPLNQTRNDHNQVIIGEKYHASSQCSTPDNSTSERLSSYGGIVSLTQKAHLLQAARPLQEHKTHSQKRTAQISPLSNAKESILPRAMGFQKLDALIQGYLCRKLLASSKVQSIIRTIKDCQNLLQKPSFHIDSHNHSSSDGVHFRECVLVQWKGALLDLHAIFFELPASQKLQLMRLPSENRDHRQTSQKASKRRVKMQQVFHSPAVKKGNLPLRVPDAPPREPGKAHRADVILKKAVHAPVFVTNSPVKAASLRWC